MELNEQNVTVKLVEDAVSEDFGKGFLFGGLTTLAIGLGVKLVGNLVVKPAVEKRKKKKEAKDWEEALDTMDKIHEDEE